MCNRVDKASVKTFSSVEKERTCHYNFDNTISMLATKNAANEIFSAKYGTLSTSMLYQSGIGTELNKDWGTLAVSFEDFLCHLNDSDKKELNKFLFYAVHLENWNWENLEEGSKLYQISKQTLISEKYFSDDNYFSGMEFLRWYSINFSPKSERVIDLKSFNILAKYIFNNDFGKAKSYIRQENKKTGINNLFNKFENWCERTK